MSNRYELLMVKLQQELPRLRLIRRCDSLFLKILFWPLTKILRRKYDTFSTTIGNTVYVPDDWYSWSDDAKYKLLRHEIMHVRQFNAYPFSCIKNTNFWWLNAFIVGFLYLLVLPVRWTMRAEFEREGYTQTLLVAHELGLLTKENQLEYADWMAEIFGGSCYAWMWNRNKAYRWALATIIAVQDGRITNAQDRVD